MTRIKLTSFLSVFLLSITAFSDSCRATCDAGGGVEVEALRTYFNNQGVGEESSFNRKLKVSEVKGWQEVVWKAWCEAMPQSFAPIAPMAEAGASSYAIPSNLEPNAIMNYVLFSKGERPEGGYPFFIYIHGSGPSDQEWDVGQKINALTADTPSVCFVPKIPNEGEWYRWWQRGKQHVWERLLRQMMASGHVDPDAIFFWGISEGGYGSQRLASFYADYLAGAGPVACGEPLINAPAENCANIAFCMTTGMQDMAWARITFSTITKEALDSLSQLHPGLYRHEVRLLPGMGHHVDYFSTTPWLREFRRNAYPRYVCWEDYAMDGRHRTEFYNIIPLDTLTFDQRRRYEMRIEDNVVRLTVEDVVYRPTELSPQWGIPLRYARTYTPTPHARLRLCLCDSLVDLSRKVDIYVNGRRLYHGRPQTNLQTIVDNCLRYGDPRRLYPAAIDLKF